MIETYYQRNEVTGQWRKVVLVEGGYFRTEGLRASGAAPVTLDRSFPLIKDFDNARVWVDHITFLKREDQ